MKKILCLLVILAFIPMVQADKKKKNQQNSGGSHSQASGKRGGGGGGGGARMPSMSRGGGGGQRSMGQSRNRSSAPRTSSRSGMSAPRSRSSSASHGSSNAAHKGPSSSNPLSRKGGQARTSNGNSMTQKNRQVGAKNNPMTQKNHQAQRGAQANPTGKNRMQGGRNGRNANAMHGNKQNVKGNMRGQHGRGFNAHNGNRGLARSARSNYRVRPYRDVYRNYRPIRHDRYWYTSHYDQVVVFGGGYYYWDAGYWYPAWGYDPAFSVYVYDGPIYSYDNLPLDQVIVNVQTELQDEGYYTGEVDGQLGPQTREALGAYQADHDLEVTSAVDEPTVEALGLVEPDSVESDAAST